LETNGKTPREQAERKRSQAVHGRFATVGGRYLSACLMTPSM
jgi:hypothetical protein